MVKYPVRGNNYRPFRAMGLGCLGSVFFDESEARKAIAEQKKAGWNKRTEIVSNMVDAVSRLRRLISIVCGGIDLIDLLAWAKEAVGRESVALRPWAELTLPEQATVWHLIAIKSAPFSCSPQTIGVIATRARAFMRTFGLVIVTATAHSKPDVIRLRRTAQAILNASHTYEIFISAGQRLRRERRAALKLAREQAKKEAAADDVTGDDVAFDRAQLGSRPNAEEKTNEPQNTSDPENRDLIS